MIVTRESNAFSAEVEAATPAHPAVHDGGRAQLVQARWASTEHILAWVWK